MAVTAAAAGAGLLSAPPAASTASTTSASSSAGDFWQYQCIDTVKYSRDSARDWNGKQDQLQALVHQELSAIKAMGATCVAIDTPYDLEFVPFMKVWVDEARRQGLTVWFRGNLSGWEGWFDYPLLNGPDAHNRGITTLIQMHPELFANGDIFTPAPEAENGLLGSPFSSSANAAALRSFLVSSYANCRAAFASIHKNVSCGFFSANGDVAKDIFTPDMVKQTGNLVVVDHYVKTAQQLGSDLVALNKEFGTKVMLGEFGAPIPDLHGDLTETQQADLINQMLYQLYLHHDIIAGVNYWVISGGSTQLLNNDGSKRKVDTVIKNYFVPGIVSGKITDTLGAPVAGATVRTADGAQSVTTAADGSYSFSIPANNVAAISAGGDQSGYGAQQQNILAASGGKVTANFELEPQNPSFWYRLRLLFRIHPLF